jgi:hypothetical protein
MLLVLSVGVGAVFAGCSSSASVSPTPAHISAVAVPLTPGPKVCRQLASDLALRQLPAAMSRLEVSSEWTVGRQVVVTAESDLRRIAAGAPKSLAPALDATADALVPLATSAPSQNSIDGAINALDTLATAGQQVCSFREP